MNNFEEIIRLASDDSVKGVCFDLYGTLIKKDMALSPYKTLMKKLIAKGCYDPGLFHRILTEPLSLSDVIAGSCVSFSLEEKAELYIELKAELASISLYDGVQNLIDRISAMGLKTSVCSNLALPYEQPARNSISNIEHWIMSFRVGCKKPESKIYSQICKVMQLNPVEILMVGDSLANDVVGPRSNGIRSIQIQH